MRFTQEIFGGVLIVALVAFLTGCDSADSGTSSGDAGTAQTQSAPAGAPTVNLAVKDFKIEGPDELSTGWTNFRLQNQGKQTHFVVLYRLADGKTIEDQKREVVPAFDAVMEALRSGEIGKAQIGEFLGARMPQWAFSAKYVGGPGLLAPGKTGETMILLDEPGTYLMECYVKAPDGTFHTAMGMLKQLHVTPSSETAQEPKADVALDLSNEGIRMQGKMTAGNQLVRVNFVDTPQAFMPYDVHLARLSDDATHDRIAEWMDWSNVGGLRAPAPVVFLGGAENTVAGRHAYMRVDLEPGRYAWISEINSGKMYREFVVE